MRICLLLLFLITSNSLGAEIETEFKVVNSPSSLYRRADVIVECPLGEGGRNFILDVKRESSGLKVSVRFRGKEIEVRQKLLNNQEVTGANLYRIEPLIGTLDRVKEIPVKVENGTAVMKVSGLQEGDYQLTYTVKGNVKTLLSPQVRLSSAQRDARSITFKIPVFFRPGEYTLNQKNRMLLEGIKSLVDTCRIRVVGYANGTPITKTPVDSNRELARKRALSVKNFLEEKGEHSVSNDNL